MTSLEPPARPRILIITLRRLGDVLLTTPLIRSIRRGFHDARVDILVFRGSDAILHGNPDIDKVHTMTERPSMGETLALVRNLFRRYDLVVCTQPGDRPSILQPHRRTAPGRAGAGSRNEGRRLEALCSSRCNRAGAGYASGHAIKEACRGAWP